MIDYLNKLDPSLIHSFWLAVASFLAGLIGLLLALRKR